LPGEGDTVLPGGLLDHRDRGCDDFRPDAIARDDGDAMSGRHPLFEPGGASAPDAVRPPDVDFTAAGRTFQLAGWRLAAVRAKIHLAIPRERAAAIRALPRLRLL